MKILTETMLRAAALLEDTTEYQSAFAEEAKLKKWELSDECVKLYFDDGYAVSYTHLTLPTTPYV